MSTSILVAVDLSHPEDAKNILKRGAQLAELDGAVLNVITVVPDFGNSLVATFFEEGTMEKALKAANTALHAFVDAALPGHGPVRHVVGSGNIYEQVLNAASQVSADLIVIGARKPNISTFLLGPNAARVARHFGGSVLIIR